MTTTRRGFFSVLGGLAALLTWRKAKATNVTDADGWGERTCEAHGYRGVPPCPVWKCENGTPHQSWVCYRIGRGTLGEGHYIPGKRRAFLRDWHRIGRKERIFYWREVTDLAEHGHTRAIANTELR